MPYNKITRWDFVRWVIVLAFIVFGLCAFVVTAPILVLGFIFFGYFAVIFATGLILLVSKFRVAVLEWLLKEL